MYNFHPKQVKIHCNNFVFIHFSFFKESVTLTPIKIHQNQSNPLTLGIIITLCTLVLIAYVFDITSGKTKIPPVILLLLLGWGVKEIGKYFHFEIPDLQPVLPVLGTVGLILIVLEGSLELEFNKSKLKVLRQSFFVAVFPLLTLSFISAYVFYYYGGYNYKDALVNSIPLFIISSAIAIPSAKNIAKSNKEFVTFESSLSDILGVILFNFFVVNATIGVDSFLHFGLELLIMIAISFAASVLLAYLLSKIKHNIKFIPIIMLLIIIYAISKIYHLPALIFIVVFGLFLGNLDELKGIKWIKKLKPEILNREIHKFGEITAEATFLIRTLFFLLFGYLINIEELTNTNTLMWSLSICGGIFLVRFIQLKVFKIDLLPLLFIAPRGLITILLFLSIPSDQSISLVNKPMILQVIIITALVMMIGLMFNKKTVSEPLEDEADLALETAEEE